jgi:ELWxxDGT repeat protein
MNKKLPSNSPGGLASPVATSRVLVFFLTLTAVSHVACAQLQLLKDINPYEEHAYNEYSMLTHGQGRMYFVVNGNELWKSNGTPESSMRLRSFESISNLTMAGTTLYFTADDGTSGVELWKSNGTVGNTVRVKDIMPGSISSSPNNLTNVNGLLYFAAYFHFGGVELWKSDGTSNGTVMVKDIAQGSSNPRSMVNANGILYFTATTSASGYELWRSDGTAANTTMVKEITAGKQSSDPQLLTYFNGKVYFTAYDPGAGRELWSSDGTNAGTTRVKDIRAGTQSATPRNLTVVNTQMMFTAHDGVHGDELWKTDGTTVGTILVKDMNPGGVGSNATNELKTPMRDFTNANGILYFVAAKGATEYIYRSDGTTSGTFIIQKANNYSFEVFQPAFTYMNGSLYFFNGTDWSEDQNLLRMPYKGTASQVMTVRIIGKPFSWSESIPVHNEMIHFYNNLYFPGRYSFNDYDNYSYGGYELMRSDGTYEGTSGVVDAFVTTEGEKPTTMIRAGKYVYMYAYGPLSYSPPLYVTDGTPEGTIEIFSQTTPIDWIAVGDYLYVLYGPYDGSDSWELRRFDGAHGVTLASGEDLWGPTLPTNLHAVGDLLYFSNGQGEVWKTDGTYEGTVRVYDLSSASAIHKVGSQTLVFKDAGSSTQIWKKTTSGETLVKDLGDNGWAYFGVVSGNVLYFGFGSGWNSNDHQLWRTDGTAAGTFAIATATDGEWDRSRMSQIMILNDEAYFSSRNSAGGTSLFHAEGITAVQKIADMLMITKSTLVNNHLLLFGGVDERTEVYGSDGTTAGTHLLTTLNTPSYSDWVHTAVIGDQVYFSDFMNKSDYVWRTNGTLCGTYPVYPGTSENFGLAALGNDLVFGGYTLKTGNEPYIYRNINALAGTPSCVEETSLTSMSAMESVEEKRAELAYPNPFTNSFTFRMDEGKSLEEIEVGIFTIYGMPVENVKNMKSGTEYDLGNNWPKGSYIIKVKTADKTITHQVMKK